MWRISSSFNILFFFSFRQQHWGEGKLRVWFQFRKDLSRHSVFFLYSSWNVDCRNKIKILLVSINKWIYLTQTRSILIRNFPGREYNENKPIEYYKKKTRNFVWFISHARTWVNAASVLYRNLWYSFNWPSWETVLHYRNTLNIGGWSIMVITKQYSKDRIIDI